MPAGPITRAASRRRALLAVGQHNSTIRPATTMARSAPPTPVGVTTRVAAARMVIGVTTRAAAARLRRAITASAGLSATISNAEVEKATNCGDAAAAAPSPLRGTGITRGRFRRNRRTTPSCKTGDATAAGSECPPAKSSGGNSVGRVSGADQRAKEGSMPSLQHNFTHAKASGSKSRHEKSPRRSHASIPPEVRPAAPNLSLPPGVAARLMVVVAAHARAVAAAAAVKKEPPPAGPAPGAPPATCDQAQTTAVHGDHRPPSSRLSNRCTRPLPTGRASRWQPRRLRHCWSLPGSPYPSVLAHWPATVSLRPPLLQCLLLRLLLLVRIHRPSLSLSRRDFSLSARRTVPWSGRARGTPP